MTRPELPSGIPGAAGGPDPAAVVDCRGPGDGGALGAHRSALLPHSFRGWRRIPFFAHKSLYAIQIDKLVRNKYLTKKTELFENVTGFGIV